MAKLTDTQITALVQAASVNAAELKEFRAPTIKRLVADGLVVQNATDGLYRVTGLGVQTLDDLGLGEGIAQANRLETEDQVTDADIAREEAEVEHAAVDQANDYQAWVDEQREADDPVVSVMMNRKDRRDMGRANRVESRRAARIRDQRAKRWGTKPGDVVVKVVK